MLLFQEVLETEGFLGKIATIKYVRENNIPFLGICLGMQMAVVEFIRNVCRIRRCRFGRV